MNNDQQTKNQRIHELLGKCWHDYATDGFSIAGRVQHCTKCLTRWNEYAVLEIMPNYYNDITAAREALAFAVEQKGAEVVGTELLTRLKLGAVGGEMSQKLNAATDPENVFDLVAVAVAIAAVLAPASVLCETVLAVYGTDKGEK